MATLFDTSVGLVSADPLAPSLREQTSADRAAERFELTEREYRKIANASRDAQEWFLTERIGAFDFNRRAVIGVWGSLSSAAAYKFWDDWHADIENHKARAWAAFERASAAFGSQVSA